MPRRAAAVLLPHDWLTWRLGSDVSAMSGAGAEAEAVSGAEAGVGAGAGAGPATDRGDASGTGYFSPSAGRWLPDLATAALGHPLRLPRIAGPAEIVGQTRWGAMLSAGTGDNMAAALGLGLGPGDIVVSIGTSGTVFAVSEVPAADPTGAVAGFADATGRFLPLVCTLNAGLVLSATAALLDTDLDGLSRLALTAPPGAGGITLLPYLDGERTPDRPTATGVLSGLTTRNMTRENLARSAVEAVLASLAEAADLLAGSGVARRRVLLIGGAARSEAVCRLAPGLLGCGVVVPEPAEYVAIGAARQAAWALAGTAAPPPWPHRPAAEHHGAAQPGLRQRYASLREDTSRFQERTAP